MSKYTFLLKKYLECRKEILKRDIDIIENNLTGDSFKHDTYHRARLAEVQHIIDTLSCIDSDKIAKEVLEDE